MFAQCLGDRGSSPPRGLLRAKDRDRPQGVEVQHLDDVQGEPQSGAVGSPGDDDEARRPGGFANGRVERHRVDATRDDIAVTREQLGDGTSGAVVRRDPQIQARHCAFQQRLHKRHSRELLGSVERCGRDAAGVSQRRERRARCQRLVDVYDVQRDSGEDVLERCGQVERPTDTSPGPRRQGPPERYDNDLARLAEHQGVVALAQRAQATPAVGQKLRSRGRCQDADTVSAPGERPGLLLDAPGQIVMRRPGVRRDERDRT